MEYAEPAAPAVPVTAEPTASASASHNRPEMIVCRERLGGLLRFYDREAA